jgi:lipopolysaccharide transport system permease protein
MQNFSASPREMAASLWRNKGLIRNLVHREVVGRYKGSMLGIFWSLATPIFMLAVYTFVFSVVFKARWNSASESQTEFALVLFAGLLVFNLFAECINRAPGLVLANVNYVKKVVFPLEVLPWVAMGSALFHFAVSFGVWLVAYVVLVGVPHWTVVFSPLVMAPFVLFVMGLSWALASLGVFLRDVGQIIGIAVQVLMFMTPIFYPASALPERFQTVMFFNPMTPPIEMMRDTMYWGHVPSVQLWAVCSLASVLVAVLGFAWFQKTRKGFADVL